MEVWDSSQIICRVCLAETGEFQAVFTSIELEDSRESMHISEMICSFTSGVQITLGDGLPEQICVSCAEETIKMYLFKLRCEETDKILRKRLEIHKNNVESGLDTKSFYVDKPSSDEANIKMESNSTEIETTSAATNILDFEQDFEYLPYPDELSDDEESSLDFQFKNEKIDLPRIEKIKDFECTICLKRFTRQDLLLRHKIAHAMKMEDFKDEDIEEEEEEKVEDRNVEIDGTFSMNEEENTIILNTEESTKMWSCLICCHVFLNESDLLKHLEEHIEFQKVDDKIIFTCKVCKKVFKQLSHIKNHLKNHNSKRKKSTRSGQKKRRLPYFKYNPGFGYVCPHCHNKYTREGHLKKHLKYHTEKSEGKPKLEEKKTNSQAKHKSQEEKNDSSHLCNHCNKRFSTKEKLFSHFKAVRCMKLLSRKKPHVCEICLKTFNQISNLKDHLRTHNGEKPFLCATCGKGFNQLGNLRQHQVRHTGIKSHLCSTCGNGFASKGELHAHLRKHTGARPFVCDTCGNGFTTSSSLTKHKRIHSGEKPYECDVCKMKFSRSGILSRHKRIHTGEKPYICKFCSKAFTQSNDLNSHLRIHTGEKPYICDQCGQAFRQSSALRTHKKIHLTSNVRWNNLCKKIIKKEEHDIVIS